MRVVRQTSTQLTLRLVPWLLWLMGGIFTGAGLMVWLALGGETVFECTRTAPAQCELTQSNPLGSRSRTFSLAGLQQAEVETHRNSDGDHTYRVVLTTDQGVVPLTNAYSSGNGFHQNRAAQINQFIQSPAAASLRIHQDDRWIGLLFLVLFSGTGLALMLVVGKVVTCDFDKSMGQLTFTKRGLLGAETVQHPLHHLVSVTLQRSSGSKGGNTYRLALGLKTGETLPLTSYYDSGKRDKEKTANAIRSFLGLSASRDWHEDPMMTLAQVGNVMNLVVGGKGKRQETIANCQNQIRQDPCNADAYYTLAMALVMQGEKEQARQVLEAGQTRCMQNGDQEKALRLNQAIGQFGLKV
ncbi:tetratricopeptide repeat protein [Pseudanabaena sp. FACHB-2040]|uniref:tetratricopeptide repeat protein n=1 Tax=Pseudanabaena sp. FACHB-2040 TaxID=2692859 RepID=UPI0016851F22|nr:tetratricopeptide repeat protein [Pseudanabaena sp. FACHB-2040]MBD2257039.1 hypothetical protein [Pseudanabaena sp. FACHB-2040]